VALSVVVNYEEGAESSPAVGDPTGEHLGEFSGYAQTNQLRDLTVESFFEYGARKGVWRLLELLRAASVKASFFACARAFEENRAVAQRVVADGHEVCYHGYRWQGHIGLSREAELNTLTLAITSFELTAGVRPVGCFVKDGLTDATREILVQLGFLYDSNSYADELPYYVPVQGKAHLVLPYAADTNDIRYWTTPGFTSGANYAEVLKRTLDGHLAEADKRPAMMTVALHARISGRPDRAYALQTFLEYAKSCPVWIARRDEIAAHWVNVVPPVSN